MSLDMLLLFLFLCQIPMDFSLHSVYIDRIDRNMHFVADGSNIRAEWGKRETFGFWGTFHLSACSQDTRGNNKNKLTSKVPGEPKESLVRRHPPLRYESFCGADLVFKYSASPKSGWKLNLGKTLFSIYYIQYIHSPGSANWKTNR